ncbi:MAG TPA: phospholipase D-like domain-containing protein, partial [Acidimicrobiales bacterium]
MAAAHAVSLGAPDAGAGSAFAAVARAGSTPAAAGPGETLIIEPDSGPGPLDELMSSAARSVDLSMYELADPRAESILVADAARGVHVRVILDQHLERVRNQAAFTYLSAHRVDVRWAPDTVDAFHVKSVCVDGARCAVMTLNLTSRYYATTRDFAVVDTDEADVTAIEQTFDDDFDGRPEVPASGTDLVWSPGSTAPLAHLIGDARHTVLVYNEELSDPTLVDGLAAAARRGVHVEVVMTYASSWARSFDTLTAAGAQVHVLYGEHPVYIHAKMIWVDGTRVFLGSQNLSVASMTRNREL